MKNILAILVILLFVFAMSGCTGYDYAGLDDYDDISEINRCSDSDNGKNYYVRGTGEGYYNGKLSHIVETCVSDPIDKMTVQESLYIGEVYCTSDDRLEEYVHECPNGCKDGACIQKTTYDTKKVIETCQGLCNDFKASDNVLDAVEYCTKKLSIDINNDKTIKPEDKGIVDGFEVCEDHVFCPMINEAKCIYKENYLTMIECKNILCGYYMGNGLTPEQSMSKIYMSWDSESCNLDNTWSKRLGECDTNLAANYINIDSKHCKASNCSLKEGEKAVIMYNNEEHNAELIAVSSSEIAVLKIDGSFYSYTLNSHKEITGALGKIDVCIIGVVYDEEPSFVCEVTLMIGDKAKKCSIPD